MDRSRRKPCKRCLGDKGDGRKGAKYCEPCAAIVTKELKDGRRVADRDPCEKCGDPKRGGHGQRYCDECYNLEVWRREKKKRYTPPKLCIGCGVKHVKGKRWKCDDCRTFVRICERCPEPARGKYKKLCGSCYYDAMQKRNENKREWEKKNPKSYPYKKKKKLTKEKRRYLNETRRLDYRLKKNIKPVSEETYQKRYRKFPPRLPAAPLAQRIEWWIASGHSLNGLAADGSVEEKRVREVYNGLVDTVRIDIADKVSMATGTTLELVYAEATAQGQNALNGDLCA